MMVPAMVVCVLLVLMVARCVRLVDRFAVVCVSEWLNLSSGDGIREFYFG